MFFDKIQVNDAGVELAYIDSGPVEGSNTYTTIIAIHGLCFSSRIFKRVQALAPRKNVRFIAVSRRNYPGSTPFSADELAVLAPGGTPAQRDAWMRDRGHEYAMLVDGLVGRLQLPPPEVVGAKGEIEGGVVLCGWSLGAGEANAIVAHADTLPEPARARLGAYVRALILHEGPPLIFGLPMPPNDWAPFHIPNLPDELKFPMFSQWVTGYFDHPPSALSTRDLSRLSYILPSPYTPSTIYNLTPEEHASTVLTGAEVAAAEVPYMMGFQQQLRECYERALFDEGVGKVWPRMVRACVAGSRAPAFGITAMWAIQDEAEKRGVEGSIKFEMVKGINHFPQWDEPEETLDLYLRLASPL